MNGNYSVTEAYEMSHGIIEYEKRNMFTYRKVAKL